MKQFPTAAHLASWAGVCPGHNESTGKIKSSQARPGNSHLKGALGIAAMAAVRTNGTFWQSRYKRLTSRRGPMRAVAIEHSMIITIWNMLTNGTIFEDLGSDHFQQTRRRTTERHAISQLHQLGYTSNSRRPRSQPDPKDHRAPSPNDGALAPCHPNAAGRVPRLTFSRQATGTPVCS
ncbi:transposase [Arthrobacter sp. OAP107]|uniref:transposase n=1 Tax=Arthrobacter sp. OAP107 TaxID=3156445 RepID=UPI003393E538